MALDRRKIAWLALLVVGGCRFELFGVDAGGGTDGGGSSAQDLAAGVALADGSGGANDLAGDLASAADMTQSTPEVGAACTGSCAGGLTCYTMTGSPGNMTPLPGGFCSKPCAGPGDCPASAQCGTIEGAQICVPTCNPSMGVSCRSGYSCCANQQIVTTMGGCGPTSSNFCGN